MPTQSSRLERRSQMAARSRRAGPTRLSNPPSGNASATCLATVVRVLEGSLACSASSCPAMTAALTGWLLIIRTSRSARASPPAQASRGRSACAAARVPQPAFRCAHPGAVRDLARAQAAYLEPGFASCYSGCAVAVSSLRPAGQHLARPGPAGVPGPAAPQRLDVTAGRHPAARTGSRKGRAFNGLNIRRTGSGAGREERHTD